MARMTKAEALACHEEAVGVAYRIVKAEEPGLGKVSVTVVECESTGDWQVRPGGLPGLKDGPWDCPACGRAECGWRFYSFAAHRGPPTVGSTDSRDEAWLEVEVGQVRLPGAELRPEQLLSGRLDWYYVAQVNHDGKVWINW